MFLILEAFSGVRLEHYSTLSKYKCHDITFINQVNIQSGLNYMRNQLQFFPEVRELHLFNDEYANLPHKMKSVKKLRVEYGPYFVQNPIIYLNNRLCNNLIS